ncbi:efflux RND transporter permease subunit [Lignipirellula cremea]|uniref:Multidrug resistance protein MdtC n=1 Tax=Lignipirellula cremea TaxID=2528010 RepID=A0A518DYY6_9BACT|nr:efflux RND transporter permease subunit [Lignipirellula cremea]QDU97056.1 Multidrug resistance protein MdtC [Lignipirellula cremea]
MRSLIRWAVGNGPGMNLLMFAVLVVGALGMYMMRREVFPEFELEIVLVTVVYPGASPEEVEQGICQKLEESVRAIDGIKKQTAVAREGSGFIILEIDPSVPDVDKILNEVRSEVERIPNFPPELAEDPSIQQVTFRSSAIKVGLLGPSTPLPDDPARRKEAIRNREWELRAEAERLREGLLALDHVSQAEIASPKAFQIDIEISEDDLRKYGLGLSDIARLVRRENIEMPGGNLRSEGEELLLRGKNKRLTGSEIGQIQVLSGSGGSDALTLGELAVVRDGFEDVASLHQIDGRDGLVISIDRTADEDLFKLTDDVKEFVASAVAPPGYELRIWNDQSIDVRDRMDMLIRNGVTGLILVFLVLTVFLDVKLAFWVAFGIPVSMLGSGALLFYTGQTLNMLSMFAFLMALGIVVDDAIVIGENIYRHREMGKNHLKASIDGACEVLPSVMASVTTTVIAHLPLMFVSGVMGKFIAVMPAAIIAMLLISLAESTFVLPCHLAHKDNLFLTLVGKFLYPVRFLHTLLVWVNRIATGWMEKFIETIYAPVLSWSLKNAWTVVAGSLALIFLSFGLIPSGLTPWIIFPKLDGREIEAAVTFPDGSPMALTDDATRRLEQVIGEIDEEYKKTHDGQSLLLVRYRSVGEMTSSAPGPSDSRSGGHLGKVSVELVSPTERDLTSQQLTEMWRERSPQIIGAETVLFAAPAMGPGGNAVEFKLLAPTDQSEYLEEAVEMFKTALREYPGNGVVDVDDDSRPGKTELQFTLNDRANALGISLADVTETVRAAYYGEEVMRLQRGRHEVKLMVRYPAEDRRSLVELQNLRVRTAAGAELPLTELANITVDRGPSEINRVNQQRSITVSADVVQGKATGFEVVQYLKREIEPRLSKEFPGVRVRWEGQAEQQQESMSSLGIGFLIAMFAMYVLLSFEFQSYLQPLLIISIIPFGAVGALIGHLVMGLPVTLFSVFGLVALAGVVVNDSIVLIDFINAKLAEGLPLNEALVEAGKRRFRPVFLTSLTTVAGLLPMLTETSFQAQLLVPMATSLCFGLMLATVMVLVQGPVFYSIYANGVALFGFTVETEEEDTPASPDETELPPARRKEVVEVEYLGDSKG